MIPPPQAPPRERTVAEKLGPLPDGIVQRAAAGDDDAFAQLYARFYEPIHHHVFTIIKDWEEAKDLTHDAFTKAWLALLAGKYAETERFQAWLYRIATNVALDEVRHRKLVVWVAVDEVLKPGQHMHEKHLFVSSDRRDSPERSLLDAEDRMLVAAAMDTIPKHDQRAALHLYEFGDLTYDQIGGALEKSRAAVKSLIFRAREHLRQRLVREEFLP